MGPFCTTEVNGGEGQVGDDSSHGNGYVHLPLHWDGINSRISLVGNVPIALFHIHSIHYM